MQRMAVPACEQALTYDCGTRGCCGLGCELDGAARVMMLNNIQSLRLQYPSGKGDGVVQKLLDLFWSNADACATTSGVKVKVRDMSWVVGGRAVCFKCWSAAAGLLTEPFMTRQKKVLEVAISAYNNRQVQYISRGNRSLATTVPPKPTRDAKRAGAVSWLVAVVGEEDEGMVQYKTTDTHAHLQNMSACKLLEKYKEYLADPENQKGGSLPPACEIGTFRAALKVCRENHEFPTFVFDKHKTQGECAVCTALRVLLQRAQASRALSDVEKMQRVAAINGKLELHNTIARMEKWSEAVREAKGRKRKGQLALTWDGYCQYKSSCFTYHGKPMADLKGASGMASVCVKIVWLHTPDSVGCRPRATPSKHKALLLTAGVTSYMSWTLPLHATPISILNVPIEHCPRSSL